MGEEGFSLAGEILVQHTEALHPPFLRRMNLDQSLKGVIPFFAQIHVENAPQLIRSHTVEVGKFQYAFFHRWFGVVLKEPVHIYNTDKIIFV